MQNQRPSDFIENNKNNYINSNNIKKIKINQAMLHSYIHHINQAMLHSIFTALIHRLSDNMKTIIKLIKLFRKKKKMLHSFQQDLLC